MRILSVFPGLLGCGLALGTVLMAASAHAQELPQGLVEAKPASSGTTDIVADGKVAGAASLDALEENDATELTISAGAMQNGGNSRMIALTTGGRFRHRRSENQISAAVAANYGQTAPVGGDWETNVQNAQGLVRYDRFLDRVTFFFQTQARNDKFQGLDLRLQLDPGVGYYFLHRPGRLFWAEVGYDLLHDIRRKDALLVTDDTGAVIERLDRTKLVHSTRGFLGAELTISDRAQWNAGVEYLQSVTDADTFRINGDTGLTLNVAGKLSVSISLAARYENKPLPGKEKLDTVTSFSLVYGLMGATED